MQKYLKHHFPKEALEGTIKEAAITAAGLDFEPISALTQSTHPHNFCCEGHVIPYKIKKKKGFKVECFYYILDAAVTSIKEIFQLLHGYGNISKCLYNAGNSENEFSEEDLSNSARTYN